MEFSANPINTNIVITSNSISTKKSQKARRVSFSEEQNTEILYNGTASRTDSANFNYKSISINSNSTKLTVAEAAYQDQEKTKLAEYCIDIKSDELQTANFMLINVDQHIELLKSFFHNSDHKGHNKIKNLLDILKKSIVMMLKNKLFYIELTSENIISKEFLFSCIESRVSSRSYKHSLHTERLKEGSMEHIIYKEENLYQKSLLSIDDVRNFFKTINKQIKKLDISHGKNRFIKYIIAVMFEEIMKEPNTKSTLFNIISVHINNINTYFTATDKLEIIKKIIDQLIYWTINYYINTDHSSDYIIKRRDNLSNIIDFLCSSLKQLLYQSAFISSFIIANNKKIKILSPTLTKTYTLNFNNIICNYGKIWGGVTLLKKHSANSNVYHAVDDTLPYFNELVKKDTILEKTDDFYLVKTEDYNLCKKRIYSAIEHTDILFKREIHTENKKYFSGVSFGLEGSVNSHIVNINEHRDFKHITEKLITAATMAMINLDDVVNPAIDAHGIDEIPSPEVYIISVCLIENNHKELELMERYNNSLLAFDNKETILDTAVFSANGTKSKLMPYGVSMDLYIKVINFNFIFHTDNHNNKIEDHSAIKNNNNTAMEKMLGKYKDGSFSSIKILNSLTKGNLDLSDHIDDENSLLVTFCKSIIKKYSNVDNDENLHELSITDFKLDDDLLLHLNKIEYLIDSLLIINSEADYNIYTFAATILLISSLIGGAQLFCCENGLSKIEILDNHIKFLATEIFIHNNTNIDFKSCFTENIVYKQIKEATQNQEERYLLY